MTLLELEGYINEVSSERVTSGEALRAAQTERDSRMRDSTIRNIVQGLDARQSELLKRELRLI